MPCTSLIPLKKDLRSMIKEPLIYSAVPAVQDAQYSEKSIM